MKLVLRNVSGESITIVVDQGATFRDLKARIYDQSGIQLDLEQLNYKGKKITDDQIITKYFFEGLSRQKIDSAYSEHEHEDEEDKDTEAEVTVEEEATATTRIFVEECSVPGCNNSVTLSPGKSFFNFPTEDDRCQHWLLVCKRLDLLDKPSSYVSQYHAICQDHFLVDQFVDEFRLKLKDGAIPSIVDVDYLGDEGIPPEDADVTQETRCHVSIKEEPVVFESDSDDCENEVQLSGTEDELIDTEENQLGLLCRLCATSINETVVFIYSPTGKEMNIAQKINMALPVAVRSADPLPKQLCMACLDKVNLCHEFSENCIRAERKLRRLNQKKVFKSSHGPAMPEQYLVPDVDTDAVAQEEIKQSLEENKENCYCCPLCRLGDMGIHADNELKSMSSEVHKMDGSVNEMFCEDSDSSSSEERIDAEDTFGLPAEPSPENYSPQKKRTCRFCNEVFNTVELCLMHAKSHAQSDIFPCSLCDLSFYNEANFIKHWEVHKTKDPKITCRSCGRLISKNNMKDHVCGSTIKAFKCLKNDCGKFFRSEERLAFHQRVHEGADPVVCNFCNKTFSRETNLFDHVRMVHKGEKKYSCTTCGKSFQLKGRLLAHNRVHTGERPFECEVCGGRFYNKATLKGHRMTHMELNLKPFQCDICGRCFTRKALFNQHQLVHLPDEIPKQQRACKLCGDIVFGSYTKLLEHKKISHPEVDVKEEAGVIASKPFKCEECGKSFAYRVTLVTHLRKHTGELPYECQYCEKRFSQKRSLVLHERTHTGEKPFECEVCGKRFAQSAHMYSHIRLHTGEKPYSCQFCDATFRLKDVKDAHVRKHTGERPYKCEVCEKTFRTSHSYYQHMWIHQGKKPYPCGYCGKAFRRSNGLKIHIRIHTGEKPHVCEVCGRGFAQKQDMKKHMNLHVNGKL